MSVGAQEVVCPECDAVVSVTIGADRRAVDAGVGHRADEPDVVNQLCTSCLEPLHVRVEDADAG